MNKDTVHITIWFTITLNYGLPYMTNITQEQCKDLPLKNYLRENEDSESQQKPDRGLFFMAEKETCLFEQCISIIFPRWAKLKTQKCQSPYNKQEIIPQACS